MRVREARNSGTGSVCFKWAQEYMAPVNVSDPNDDEFVEASMLQMFPSNSALVPGVDYEERRLAREPRRRVSVMNMREEEISDDEEESRRKRRKLKGKGRARSDEDEFVF